MMPLDAIKRRLEQAVPGVRVDLVANPGPADQASLRVDRAHALAVAQFLRNDPELRFDYASNVTGIDWPDTVERSKVKVTRMVDGVAREFEDAIELKHPGRLEVVYHLYSMALRQGPLILRVRTENRQDRVQLTSLTPVWRSCEFQEREIYDLFGVQFEGHPDLRRILMWEGFQDHPMRKDYQEPDDYEYEPTPHDDVLERAQQHYPKDA